MKTCPGATSNSKRGGNRLHLLIGEWKGYFAKECLGWEILLQPFFETQSAVQPKPKAFPWSASNSPLVPYLAQALCTAVGIHAFLFTFSANGD